MRAAARTKRKICLAVERGGGGGGGVGLNKDCGSEASGSRKKHRLGQGEIDMFALIIPRVDI